MKKRRRSFFKSFKTRLITVSLLFLLLGILLPVIISSRMFLRQLQTENESETVLNFSRTATRINELLDSASMSGLRIQSEDVVYEYITTGYQQENSVQKTIDRIAFIDAVQEGMQLNDALNAVMFFRKDGTMCGVSNNWNFFEEDEPHPFVESEYFKNVSDTENSTVWAGAFPKNEFTKVKLSGTLSTDDLLICGLRKSTYALQPVRYNGVIMLVSVKEEALRECFEFISDEESSVCLLNESGVQISGTDFSLFNMVPEYYSEFDPDLQYDSIFYESAEHVEYQIVYYRLENPDWTLVKMIPTSVQQRSTNRLIKTAIVVGLVFLVGMTVIYTLWAIRFTRPINQVTEALVTVRDGDLDVHITENARTEEIQTMQQQFNQMIDSIQELLAQKEKNEQEKLLLEMKNLQAQIDPHFIYNSITSIRWMATMAGADKVADMLVVLISLLRPIFSDWTLDWTIDEELAFVENYMKLMRMRYGNRISMKIEEEGCPATVGSLRIPRFSLQPLLENCCEHGIMPDRPLQILISISVQGEYLIIRVQDDGAGMDAETMNWLNARFADSLQEPLPPDSKRTVHSNGIGLININRRLKLRYGEAYGLTFNTPPERGTCIEVRISSARGNTEEAREHETEQ